MADDEIDIVMDMARYIWRKGITIGEFYEALGVQLDALTARGSEDVTARLSGIFDGWKNPPDPEDSENPN